MSKAPPFIMEKKESTFYGTRLPVYGLLGKWAAGIKQKPPGIYPEGF